VPAQVIGHPHCAPAGGLHDLQLQRALRAAHEQASVDISHLALLQLLVHRTRRLDAQPLRSFELEEGPDARRQGAHHARELGGGAARVQAALGGRDLLRVRHALLRLLGELQHSRLGGLERFDQELAAQPREPRRERAAGVVEVDRLGALERARPAVEPLGQLDDRHTGVRVARHQRALDRRGAAPARQQGRMHVQHQVVRQERLADELPELAHANPCGRRGVDGGARL